MGANLSVCFTNVRIYSCRREFIKEQRNIKEVSAAENMMVILTYTARTLQPEFLQENIPSISVSWQNIM